jgi:hypothetical protein
MTALRRSATIAAGKVERKIDPEAQAWLTAERGLSPATLAQLDVASGTTFFPDLGRKCPAIFFGFAEGWKARAWPDKGFVSAKGFVRSFWNLDRVLFAESETVFITEGELDACALVEAGISATQVLSAHGAKVVASTDPKSMAGYAYVDAALEAGLSKVKRFVWCGDGDDAGPGAAGGYGQAPRGGALLVHKLARGDQRRQRNAPERRRAGAEGFGGRRDAAVAGQRAFPVERIAGAGANGAVGSGFSGVGKQGPAGAADAERRHRSSRARQDGAVESTLV